MKSKSIPSTDKALEDFLQGKSTHTLELFHHFIEQYQRVGEITIHPTKTMIGIATPSKRIAYMTHLGKDFIHVVFTFEKSYPENLCFQKIAQVPGDAKQYNHHLRMYAKGDLNKEVLSYMKLAFTLGS